MRVAAPAGQHTSRHGWARRWALDSANHLTPAGEPTNVSHVAHEPPPVPGQTLSSAAVAPGP